MNFEQSTFKELEQQVWEAFESISPTDNGPNVLNIDEASGTWKVNPAEFYRWLNAQGISVPDSLDSLMQFVMTVVKKRLHKQKFLLQIRQVLLHNLSRVIEKKC